MAQPTSTDASGLSLDEPTGRWVLAAMVLGSSLAFIDATVVSIALPAIGTDLDAGLAGLAWTVNAYTLSLAALILLGGSLGDRLGRRRVFLVGVVWFACASLLCGISPNLETLVAARALQGVGGALLTPGSLAILQSAYRQEDRARAIGAWSGLGGVAGAAGPFLGGWLVEAASWRWIFLINVPVALAVVVIATRCVPESQDPTASRHADVVGAVLVAIGLAGLTYGLLAWPDAGLRAVSVWLPLLMGAGALMAFLVWEGRAHEPMLPLGIFSSALFNATNLVTFVVYAALGGVFFWLVLTLQVVAGFTPLAAGTALLPITIVMLVLSARAGALGQRIGPRLPMTAGPLLAALGVAGMVRIGEGSSYLADVLPSVTVLGFGLALTVAPLTATALAAAPAHHAGLASGVNNAVARVAGLLAVAVLPVVVGLSGEAYSDPDVLEAAFSTAMWVCAALLALGGLLAAVLVRTPVEEPVPSTAGRIDAEASAHHHCSIDAPPLAPTSRSRASGP
jgi:EmrB/QacA subfamily drug resistance transporter